jgi:hypothetical protein
MGFERFPLIKILQADSCLGAGIEFKSTTATEESLKEVLGGAVIILYEFKSINP